MKRNDIEIMAPVGSFESLMAAIQARANAVYFGLGKLNMRSRASANFSIDDLKEIVQHCEKQNVKTYLALNIILYDHELDEMRAQLQAAKKHNISAIIASDQAVLNYARELNLEVHLSTQLNISNLETIKLYTGYADVVVLARELNLNQVRDITNGIKKNNITGPSGNLIKVEMFVHGALCMSISGKCYLSLHEQNYSANRGACLQHCRKGYTVKEKSTYNTEKIEKWDQKLESVFNRGFWDGYYLGQKLGEWSHVYGSKATERKVYVGNGKKYFDRMGIGEFYCQAAELAVGEKIIITGPTTGFIETEVKEFRVDHQPVQKVCQGQRFSLPIEKTIRPSDKLYKVIKSEKTDLQNQS